MEVTYAEFCELLESTPLRASEFATWATKYALAQGVDINKCVFKLSGWMWIWEVFNDEKSRAELEAMEFEHGGTNGRL